jgi:PTS system nitrogen regulatory IIA component
MGEKRISLVDVFPASSVLRDLKARDKKAAIKELLQHSVARGVLKEDAAKKAEKAILKRETMGSTAIGKGLAIPHAKGVTFVDELVGVFGRSREGVPFDSVDGGLVHVLFVVVSPASMASEHLNLMKRIAMLHRDEKTLRYLAMDERLESLQAIFMEVDEQFT